MFYVVRWKRNIKLEAVSSRPVEPIAESERSTAKVRVRKDEIVKPATSKTASEYSAGDGTLRCVTAEVEYDGQMLEMSFLTNNLEWSARTIAELYPDFPRSMMKLAFMCGFHHFSSTYRR